MAKVIVHTDEAPKSLAGYSQAVKSGGFVFVAGQGPFNAKTDEVMGTTIQEQTAQCLKNIAAILQAANGAIERAVSATFFLGEESDFAGMNEEWENGLLKPTQWPVVERLRSQCNSPFGIQDLDGNRNRNYEQPHQRRRNRRMNCMYTHFAPEEEMR